MKILQSSVFRAISAIAIGCLLIKYPDNTVTWITVAIGILFLLSGLISLIVYVHARKNVSEFKVMDKEGHVIAGENPPSRLWVWWYPDPGCHQPIYESDKCPQIWPGQFRLLGIPVSGSSDWTLCDHQTYGSCQYGDAHSGLVLITLRCNGTG